MSRDTLTGCLEKRLEPTEQDNRGEPDIDAIYQKWSDEKYEYEFI